MNEGVQIEFPKRDADALFRQMQQAIRYLNYDAGRALSAAAGYLVRSIGASTKIAPKNRIVQENKIVAPARGRRGYKSFDVTGFFGRPRTLQTRTVRAQSLRDAKRRYGTIRNRGLAKATWSVALRNFGRSGAGAMTAAQQVARKAADFVTTTKNLRGDDPVITIRNRLPYAEAALAGGPKDVNTAMARAAESMQKSIENQLVRRMGLGRLSR